MRQTKAYTIDHIIYELFVSVTGRGKIGYSGVKNEYESFGLIWVIIALLSLSIIVYNNCL